LSLDVRHIQGYTELLEQNISLSHLWPVNFHILMISLAKDINLAEVFKQRLAPAAVQLNVCFYIIGINFEKWYQ
jgi:hypothetical protein